MDGVNMGEIELPGLGQPLVGVEKKIKKFYISVSQTTIPLAKYILIIQKQKHQ